MMILGQNAGIECKNHKILKIQDWWEQTKKLESLRREPVLVFKIHGEPMAETKCVIYLDTLLELIKASKDPVEIAETPDNRQLKWDLQNLKNALQKVIRHL